MGGVSIQSSCPRTVGPGWHEDVLGIDTGVQIAERRYGRLTVARIDEKDI